MLSGIGDAGHLRDHGIAVFRDLPGVGANLQDHLDVAAAYHCPLPVSLYSRTKGYRSLLIGLHYLTSRSGLGAQNGMSTGAFLKSRADLERPDLQLHFVAGIMDNSAGKSMAPHDGFSIDVTPLHPVSRGQVSLGNSDPLSPAEDCAQSASPRGGHAYREGRVFAPPTILPSRTLSDLTAAARSSVILISETMTRWMAG